MYRKIYAGKFRCPGWFSLGLRDLLRRVLHPSPDEVEEAWFKAEFKEEEEEDEDEGAAREMTTFDILSFSAGSDLSALLGAGPGKERVFVGEAAGAMLSRVEAAGRKAGYRVQRGGGGSISSSRAAAGRCTWRRRAAAASWRLESLMTDGVHLKIEV
jgi:hypothetical protein